jgi:hypothetical protein
MFGYVTIQVDSTPWGVHPSLVRYANSAPHKYPGWRSGDRALLTVTSALMEQYMRPPALAAMRGGHETILLAEDEKSPRVLVQTALSRLGYRVLEVSTGVRRFADYVLNVAVATGVEAGCAGGECVSGAPFLGFKAAFIIQGTRDDLTHGFVKLFFSEDSEFCRFGRRCRWRLCRRG